MRHFPPPGPITSLTLGVVHTAGAAALIPRSGRAPRRPPCGLGAVRAAVAVAAIAVAADRHLTATAGAVEQTGGRGHRQLLPMSPGSSPTSGRYLPMARATHGPGYGTGEDCGGRDQCRTCLNGTDAVDHGAVLVISRSDDTRPRALPLGRAHVRRRYQARGPRRSHAGREVIPPPFSPDSPSPLRPSATDRSSPPPLAMTRAIRQRSAGLGSHRHGSAPRVARPLRPAVARDILGVLLPPGAPVLRVLPRPGLLRGVVVGPVVRITGALATLPVALTRPLAGRLRTVGLGRILGARLKGLAATAAAGRMAHLFHRSARCLTMEVCSGTRTGRSAGGALVLSAKPYYAKGGALSIAEGGSFSISVEAAG